LVSFPSFAHALSAPGDACKNTAECSTGYCLDSKCIVPTIVSHSTTGACAQTSDCSQGYCVAGECILPTAKSEILQLGIKGGCAGLTEQTSALGSLAICEAVWVLVPVFSIAAAYTASRAGHGRELSAAVLLFPLFASIIFFAFLGVIVALAEIALLVSRRKYA
jgi:hypothetical protein